MIFRLRYLTLTLCFTLSGPAPLCAQSPDTILPPAPVLVQSLEAFHRLQLEAQLSEYEQSQKLHWLKYLPTLGLSYTLEGQPRPGISWSSQLIYSGQQDKERREAKRRSLRQQARLAFEADRRTLLHLRRQYQFAQQDLQHLRELHRYDQQLFELQKSQAEDLQITPTQLLQARRSMREKEYQLLLEARALLQLRIKILDLVRWDSGRQNSSY